MVLNRGSYAEPSRPKITISRAMSRLIGRAFSAVLAADDIIEAEPRVEFCGGEFTHLLEKSQIASIMIVFAHFLLLDGQ